MNILLTLLYSVVWLVCTILGRVAPESVARAWCEYQLEGMSLYVPLTGKGGRNA
ncbi:hypothetical protein CS815_005185 [Escherichia coli]|nr:hypothetical protein [Escherichia coli]